MPAPPPTLHHENQNANKGLVIRVILASTLTEGAHIWRHTDAIGLWDSGPVDDHRMAKYVFIVNLDAPSCLVIHGMGKVNKPMGWMVGHPQHLSHEAGPFDDANRSRMAISKRAHVPSQEVLASAERTSGVQFPGLDDTSNSLVAVEYAVNGRSVHILMLNLTSRLHRLLEENYQAHVPALSTDTLSTHRSAWQIGRVFDYSSRQVLAPSRSHAIPEKMGKLFNWDDLVPWGGSK